MSDLVEFIQNVGVRLNWKGGVDLSKNLGVGTIIPTIIKWKIKILNWVNTLKVTAITKNIKC